MRLSTLVLASLTVLAVPFVLGACDDGEVLPAPSSDKTVDDDGVLGNDEGSSSSSGSTDAGSTTGDDGSDTPDSGSPPTDAGASDAADGG